MNSIKINFPWGDSRFIQRHPGHPDQSVHGRRKGAKMTIGITSYHVKTNPINYRKVMGDMKKLTASLSKLKGVKNVKVGIGTGGWEGGAEPTMRLSYDGNGEAIKALAAYGKQKGQDGVLFMKKAKKTDPGAEPNVEVTFDKPMNSTQRAIVETLLVNKIKKQYDGDANVGWTWGKRNGKRVLTSQCVPQWGGERAKHEAALAEVMAELKAEGAKFNAKTNYNTVGTADIYDDSPNNYDAITNGKSPFDQ